LPNIVKRRGGGGGGVKHKMNTGRKRWVGDGKKGVVVFDLNDEARIYSNNVKGKQFVGGKRNRMKKK